MVKSDKTALKTGKVWLVQPVLHPAKPWFNQAFGAKAAARKVPMRVKNITDFWRFCHLNIPCLKINITLIFISYSSEEFTHK